GLTIHVGSITGAQITWGSINSTDDARNWVTMYSGALYGYCVAETGNTVRYWLGGKYEGLAAGVATEDGYQYSIYGATECSILGTLSVSGDISGSGNVLIANGKSFQGYDTSGVGRFLAGVNSSNQVLLGSTNCATYIRGTSINLTSLTCTGAATVKGILYLPDRGIVIANAYGVYHYLTDGSFARFECVNDSDQFILGRSAYPTYLYGSSVTSNKSITVSSDRRLKQGIRPLDGRERSLVDALSPVSYRLRDDPEQTHYGFVAQDMEEALAGLDIVDSALVQSNAADGMKSVAYEEIIPLLVEEIHSLKKQVRDLRER
ncbi:MAG: tail fiber domain-containing protein, partial [Clostridiales bacterium]|nr:tail fiber domain-containing protein [Clostridiales bacterium]